MKRGAKPTGQGAEAADWRVPACCFVLAAAAVAAYGRTFSVPLLFDDKPTILDNATIRHWATALVAPADTTAAGRPVVNLSLALNYAISGTRVWSYHAFNLAVHILAGLSLFGIARRLRAAPSAKGRLPLAFCAALIWILHPLHAESVTYIVQRAESLMGLFYLQSIYWFVRWLRPAEEPGPARQLCAALSVVFCAVGMGTKEVMVSAPLIVLLLDRLCFAGSFAEAWRRRKPYYAAMAATWIPLFALVAHTGIFATLVWGAKSSTVENSLKGTGISDWQYWATQPEAICRYLKLAAWPRPLVFDYGTQWIWTQGHPATAWVILTRLAAPLLVVGVLLAITIRGLVRNSPVGLLGAFFFAVLAPTSMIPTDRLTAADHRMYLALIPPVLLVTTGIFGRLGRIAVPLCLLISAALGLATFRRNLDFSSEQSIWSDTVAKLPDNEWARMNMGLIWLGMPGHLGDAMAEYREAIRLRPGFADAHNNLGVAWLETPGHMGDAIAEYEEAIRLKPDLADAHNNLGVVWMKTPGRLADAIAEFQETIRLRPDIAEAHVNLGEAWMKVPGRLGDAVNEFLEALRLRPDDPRAHSNMGIALSGIPGRSDDSIAEYEQAVRLKPGLAESHYDLATALSNSPGRLNDAVAEYEEALRLRPDFVDAHYNLATALSNIPGRLNDAVAQYEAVLKLTPDDPQTHFYLAVALSRIPGRGNEARAHLEAVLRLQPGNEPARKLLGEIEKQAP